MKKLIIAILLTLSLATSLSPIIAYAGNFAVTPRPETLPGPTLDPANPRSGRGSLIDTILPNYAVAMIGFVGAAAFIFLVISGVRYAMSYGNEEAIKKAKDQTIYALVGFVIALLSYTIVTIIANLKFEGDTSTGAAQPATSTAAPAATPTPSP